MSLIEITHVALNVAKPLENYKFIIFFWQLDFCIGLIERNKVLFKFSKSVKGFHFYEEFTVAKTTTFVARHIGKTKGMMEVKNGANFSSINPLFYLKNAPFNQNTCYFHKNYHIGLFFYAETEDANVCSIHGHYQPHFQSRKVTEGQILAD